MVIVPLSAGAQRSNSASSKRHDVAATSGRQSRHTSRRRAGDIERVAAAPAGDRQARDVCRAIGEEFGNTDIEGRWRNVESLAPVALASSTVTATLEGLV